MSKLKNLKALYIPLIVVVVVLLLFLRAKSLYYDTLSDTYEILPSSGNGFSMQTVEKNISTDENEAAVLVSLRPGDEYTGSLLVKNHELRSSDFLLYTFGDIKRWDQPDLEGKIVVELEPSRLYLESYEWKLVHYKLIVPSDMEYGDYEGMVTVRRDEDVYVRGGIPLTYAMGVDFVINVAEEPIPYQYSPIVEDIDLKEFAKNKVIMDLKRSIGIIFVILTVYFFYMAMTVKKS